MFLGVISGVISLCRDMPARPWIDDFPAGYMQRSMHLLPRQGDHMPWMHTQDYWLDKEDIPAADLGDGSLVFD